LSENVQTVKIMANFWSLTILFFENHIEAVTITEEEFENIPHLSNTENVVAIPLRKEMLKAPSMPNLIKKKLILRVKPTKIQRIILKTIRRMIKPKT